ncbi:MAG: ABC transporter ATP-binding protein [Rubrobacteraceae bacterium]
MSKLLAGARRLLAGVDEENNVVAAAPPVPVCEIFLRFCPSARVSRRWILISLVFVALTPAIEAASIWMYKVLVDDVLIPKDFGVLGWVILVYLGLTIFGGVVSFFDEYLSAWVGESFLVSLRTGFFRHLHGLSLGFFDHERLGDILSRLSDDVDAIEELVLEGMTSALSYAFQLLFFVGALFYLQWKLALISLFVIPLFWIAARYFSRKIKQASREERRRTGSIGAVAEESLSNAALVQAYGRQEDEVARFHKENEGSFVAQMAATRLGAVFSPLVDLIELMGVLVVIAFGAWELSQGRLSVGGLLVFLVYLSQLYRPIRGLSRLLNTVYAASASAERIIEFLDREPAVKEHPWARPLPPVRGFVELDGVSFQYPGTRERALDGVSLLVRPGETLALVGPSGSGKSTIAKLLLRFLDPDDGAVRLDGHDLRDLTLRSVRENVAVLFQETLLFDGSVRENIAYGRPDATEEEIVAAARTADANEFIEQLSEGYDTRIGQKGRLLSGGQRQRIAMARAVVRDAPILILDEPTTGLDADTARRMMEPLKRLMEGRATIIVSHDLDAVRDADRIVVLEDGRSVETGTHEELAGRNGVAGAWARQA